MNVLTVFLAALVTALATGLGALPFVGRTRTGPEWLAYANALAAGFMIGASAGLLYEGASRGPWRTAAGALIGGVFIEGSRRFLGHRREHALGGLHGADARKAVLIIGVMTIHSFTEGVGVGVAFGDGETLGLLIAIAIAVHNIPEGLAISLVLVPRGAPVRTAAGWSIFSSLPQPLMAVPAFAFVTLFEPLLPAGLGFAAGAMLWMVARELLPDTVEAPPAAVAATTAASAGAMIAMQVLLLG